MFELLAKHRSRPEPYSYFNTSTLWTDPHISSQMLDLHLDERNDVASRSRDKIEAIIRWFDDRFDLRNKRLLDLGCGPGLYSVRMADRGAVVTGLDFSERSINHAKASNHRDNLDFVRRDYLKDRLPGDMDLVTLIYGDICALPPGRRETLFNKIRAALRPGGHLVLDAFSLPQFRAREESATYDYNLMDGFWSPNPYFGFVTTFLYREQTLALDRYLIVEETQSWEVFNWLQYFTPEQLGTELQAAGFAVEGTVEMLDGSPWQGGATEFGVIAKTI